MLVWRQLGCRHYLVFRPTNSWAGPIAREALQQIAAGLGAGRAFLWPGRPALWRVVLVSVCSRVTMPGQITLAFPAQAWRRPTCSPTRFLQARHTTNAGAVFTLDHGHNDSQPVVERLEPRIGALAGGLGACAWSSRRGMTGLRHASGEGSQSRGRQTTALANLSSQVGKAGPVSHHRSGIRCSRWRLGNRQCYNLLGFRKPIAANPLKLPESAGRRWLRHRI